MQQEKHDLDQSEAVRRCDNLTDLLEAKEIQQTMLENEQREAAVKFANLQVRCPSYSTKLPSLKSTMGNLLIIWENYYYLLGTATQRKRTVGTGTTESAAA